MAGLGRGGPLFPRELETVHLSGDVVVDSAGVERIATVEPPGIKAGAVPRAEFAEDGEQVRNQAGLVRSMIADGVLPGGVIGAVAGLVVVENEAQAEFVAGISQFADHIAP